ncbi:unnamed protein product [Alopecurus aequalis]
MAASSRRSNLVFVVAQDASVLGNVVFNLNLKHLFSSQPEAEDEPVLSLPAPVACFKQNDCFEYMAFAASPSGDVIASASTYRRTLIHRGGGGGGAVSRGPTMRSAKSYLFLVPVGDHMFFAMSAYPGSDDPQGSQFEALQLRPGGRWAWTAIKDPPGLARQERKDVTGYFVSGARVYVSSEGQGTYSYDTARRRWRSEGAWELPVHGRGILVPNFLGTGRRLLMGFRSPSVSDYSRPLCVVDMDARPPAVLASWPEAAVCPLQAWRAGYVVCPYFGQLIYFGGGRFCISINVQNCEKPVSRGVLSFMAFELTPELQLIKLKSSCYLMPQSSRGEPAVVI